MKRNYEQPQIEVLDIQIEKGFAQSDGVDIDIDGWGPGSNSGGSAE